MEFDAEFKFAKIQNSHWGGGSWNLMLSSNLLKSKLPICGGGGGWWNQSPTFDAESKFAKKKKKLFCKKFSKFLGKNVPGNGFRL